ncbi:FAD-dependent oxidoreductase [Pontixanthobacter aestiaquae]|uniref:FAD-dependent oxidoreductase n=1 Tax=Pontixanthobacter aestiaquae TaxID=1509367 RepID=A0A844Z769_9SPHN|nr:FAD-dependent oxidoreductase [Pontixanthobacter aestiaquae]MDN3646286.1 FAD-dependent oxidoreductase [Pontixanthobacter aestiaquae]MXO82723.1 FAD-dependent oxidoreductase [Pontixanthobacter aestiaquae]
MAKGKNVVVIGAGIIGVTTAHALARTGWKVTMLDAREGPALGTSLGNGRQLSYSHTDALANPRLLAKIPALAMGLDDAFQLSLRPEPALLEWLARFVRNCTAARFRGNTLACLSVAQRSRRELDLFLSENPIDFQYSNPGKLVLFRSKTELAHAAQSMDLKVCNGTVQRAVGRDEALALEPALGQCGHELVGAIYSPADGVGNCSLFATQLVKHTQREYGLNYLRNALVTSISERTDGMQIELADGNIFQTPMAVICTGHESASLLRRLGHRIPVQPMKGYSFTAPRGPNPPTISITDSAHRLVFTDIGDQVLVAGIADLGDGSAKLDEKRIETVLNTARKAMPDAADYDAATSFWTGHRPVTPNSQPITKRLGRSLAVNTGHGMLGWTMAMGSAAILAEELAQE